MSKNLFNILLILAIFALYYLVIGPLYKGTGGVWQPEQNIKALKELNAQYDETLAQADTLYTQAETLRSQYSRISDDQKQKMGMMVPDQIDKVRLLSEMNNVAAQSGLVLSALGYSEGSVNSAGRGTASLSFSVRSTYSEFKNLMDNIEKSLRLFSIQNVTFTSTEGALTTYQVRLDTYFIK